MGSSDKCAHAVQSCPLGDPPHSFKCPLSGGGGVKVFFWGLQLPPFYTVSYPVLLLSVPPLNTLFWGLLQSTPVLRPASDASKGVFCTSPFKCVPG